MEESGGTEREKWRSGRMITSGRIAVIFRSFRLGNVGAFAKL